MYGNRAEPGYLEPCRMNVQEQYRMRASCICLLPFWPIERKQIANTYSQTLLPQEHCSHIHHCIITHMYKFTCSPNNYNPTFFISGRLTCCVLSSHPSSLISPRQHPIPVYHTCSTQLLSNYGYLRTHTLKSDRGISHGII